MTSLGVWVVEVGDKEHIMLAEDDPSDACEERFGFEPEEVRALACWPAESEKPFYWRVLK